MLLYVVMPMYNLIEYSPNYSEKTGSFWFSSKDEATDSNNDIENTETQKLNPMKITLMGF